MTELVQMAMFSDDAFSGYQGVIEIHSGANSRVYRARRTADDRPVILKVLQAEYPTSAQLRRYRQEYHLAQHLQLANVVKAYALEAWQRSLVIVFEDCGGLPLNQWLQAYSQGLPIALFLPVAVQIAQSLGQLHGQGVIHKDINPSNIVLNPETLLLKLIDLGISTQLSRETPFLQPPSILEGTLAYLSPEQTGRVNRTLDYRTDFYSLGVTFYELLSGKMPFACSDPMELVHCHIARQPASLLNLKPGQIPPALAEIVNKLMAKNSEDRYQNAWGLKADLEECVAQWKRTESSGCTIAARIASFPLGRQDISDQLRIPQRLYGREREMAVLMAAFERIAGSEGAEEQGDGGAGEQKVEPLLPIHPSTHPLLILVTGYSGIGKSALVRSLYPAITARRGYFISGKFDQFQRHTPYSAVVDAIAGLVKQLLSESDVVLQRWRSRLLQSLEGNGQVVIDVIPEVELIIGAQPPLPELGASETQNRFNRVFQRFIQALCTPEHPLVLFLDDLQWADQATLNLLEQLLGDSPIRHLLLVAAYRDNEISASHPLALAIAHLQQNANLTQITVDCLSLGQVQQLIADTLHQQVDSVRPLAELVRRKTEGNPFFVNQFLQTLHREKLLTLDASLGQWQWNLAQIEAIGFTDNVVELMVSQLQRLPASVQPVLATAAYLGTAFDLETLSLIQNRSPAALFADLTQAIDQGFVVGRSPLDENLLIQHYQFGHDRIQQAAYSLIAADEEQATHLQIGRLLLAQTSPQQQASKLFDLLNHFNIALPLIQVQAERDMLAQLNLQAAQKARASTAFAAALTYARSGAQILGTIGWQRQHRLTLALHEAWIEAACFMGDRETVLALAQVVFSHAKAALDRVKTYETLIQFYSAQKQHAEAIACGLEFLKALRVRVPSRPGCLAALRAILLTKMALWGKSNQTLLNLPEIQNRQKRAAVRILNLLMLPAYFVSPHLMVVLFTTGIKLTLHYGNSPWSASFYGSYGIVLARLGDLQQSYRFGKLALALGDRFNDLAVIATVKTAVSWHCQPWREPLQATLPAVEDGIKAALNSGNLLFLGISAYMSLAIRLDLGMPIEQFVDQISTAKNLISYSGDANSKLLLDIYCRGVFNLQHSVDQPALLAKSHEAEAQLIAQFEAQGDIAALSGLYAFKTFLAYLFGDRAAIAYADAQLPYEVALKGGYVITLIWLYDSLARLAAYPHSPAALQQRLLQRVIRNQRSLRKYARLMPANFQAKFDLVEAEKFRVLGRFSQAIECYERAIGAAKKSACLRDEALASELAAKFYLDWGKEKIARGYMTEARYAYLRWGAAAKVQQLEKQYPQLYESFARVTAPIPTKISLHSDRRIGADLDIATVMKASRAIASEIVLDRLLQTLLQILLENAGAQAGCLLLPAAPAAPAAHPANSASFTVAIHSHADRRTASIPPLPQILPESLLYYVARTQNSVVLNQIDRWGEFGQDAYLQTAKPLSVLCYPLRHQRELVGIVYLENRITAGVFTDDRIEFLQLLSGQMAIALRNAQLYAEKLNYTRTLELKVAERTAELEAANAELLRLATVDNLTKIANRRRFDDYLAAEWQRHLREQRSLVLILMDIDYFKRYNDHYGHQRGDDCLIRVAQTLAQSLQRPTDLVARYGGEEFAAILPNTSLQGGLVVAEALRTAIAALAIPHAQSDVSSWVTLSLGVAALQPKPELHLEMLIADADHALYQAKRQGRNRVIVYAA